MTDLSSIPTEVLLRDRQESHNDLTVCAIAKIQGDDRYLDGEKKVDDRIDGNLRIISTISDELRKRGIDWL